MRVAAVKSMSRIQILTKSSKKTDMGTGSSALSIQTELIARENIAKEENCTR
jgi:hypothetical protein